MQEKTLLFRKPMIYSKKIIYFSLESLDLIWVLFDSITIKKFLTHIYTL